MAQLTQEDVQNYNKFTTSLKKLKIFSHHIENILKQRKINLDEVPKNTNELGKIIDLLDLVFKLLIELNLDLMFETTNPDETEKLKQDLFNSFKNLKRSIEVVQDEILELTDEIDSTCSDSVIIQFLQNDYKQWTQDLLSDRDPNLTEQQIERLIAAWGQAVNLFVEDAIKKGESDEKVTPGKPETFAHFFCIHEELETLYSELADTEIFQKSR